jgi:integrase
MHARTIYARIVALTNARFGRPIHPHLFRDAAATAIATYDPKHIGVAMPVLGHSSPKTSQRYYDQSRTIEAMRLHHRYVEEIARAGCASSLSG